MTRERSRNVTVGAVAVVAALAAVVPAGASTVTGGPPEVRFAQPVESFHDIGIAPQHGDFDGDGHLDALARVSTVGDDPYVVLLGDGTGAFHDAGGDRQLRGEQVRVIADLDGDGRDDLVSSRDTAQEEVRVWLARADLRFERVARVPVGQRWWDAPAADLDGDGDLDLLVYGGRRMLVLEGDGSGAAWATHDPALEPGAPTVVDVDAEGVLDVVVSAGEPRRYDVHLGDGDLGFTLHSSVDRPRYLYGPVLADVDGDGHVDLTQVDSRADKLKVLGGDGTGDLGTWQLTRRDIRGVPNVLDYNADGAMDLRVGTSFLLGRGDRAFQRVDSGLYGRSVDVDADGLPDLVTAPADADGLAVRLNVSDALEDVGLG